jgi:hypothetical protein
MRKTNDTTGINFCTQKRLLHAQLLLTLLIIGGYIRRYCVMQSKYVECTATIDCSKLQAANCYSVWSLVAKLISGIKDSRLGDTASAALSPRGSLCKEEIPRWPVTFFTNYRVYYSFKIAAVCVERTTKHVKRRPLFRKTGLLCFLFMSIPVVLKICTGRLMYNLVK